MNNQNYNKLNKKTELKIHLIVFTVLTIVIVLDYLNVGLPCFF
jgi:hypothetical protein